MSGYIEEKTDARQYNFMPTCYDELIEENNPVRVLDAFVNLLDMVKLNFKYAETKSVGRKPYNPKMMLKLYLYGYFNGIRSSRKLERECNRNIELFWLIGELKPDFKTIADFRKDNIKNIKGVFTEFSLLCDELKLLGKEIVAIDGSKFRANNSRKKNYSKGKLEKQIKYYEESAEKYMALLNEEDKEETATTVSISKEELQTKICKAKTRIEEMRKLKETVEKNGEISVTDVDSRQMKTNNNGLDICHNVQISVDNKEHLVIAVDVTSSPADQRQLYNMAEKSKKELGVEEITAIADKGYWCGEELKKCEENRVTAIVSSPEEQGNAGYKKSNFKYDEKNDCYICPMGNMLLRKGIKESRYSNKNVCKNCPNKNLCTSNKKGRTIVRDEKQEYLIQALQRQKENMDLYNTRKIIVEHIFGTVKRTLGYTYFLLRGNEKVKGESFMHFLIYNIKRVCNIVPIDKIIGKIMLRNSDFFACLFKESLFLIIN